MTLDVAGTGPEPVTAKVDPETLALRARAPRTIRFRRTLIIGLTTSAIAALLGVTAWALHPTIARLTKNVGDNAQTTSVKPTELLTEAPASYSELHKTTLPGASGYPPYPASNASGGSNSAGDEKSAVESQGGSATQQRIAAAKSSALGSPVLMQIAQPELQPELAGAPPAVLTPGENDPDLRAASLPATPDPNNQQHKADLIRSGTTPGSTVELSLTAPASPWVLSAGTIISASLITGLNSDLPGFITAQVTEDVYDSATGSNLLIPQGSRLLGKSDNGVSYGQRRALIVWQRLILPDGSALKLDNLPATDQAGYAGLTDSVDGHGWALLKGVALSTLIGVGSELSFGSSDSDLVRALRQSTETAADHAGQQITTKTLDVQPTIHVRPGWPIRVVLHEDLNLRPWGPAL